MHHDTKFGKKMLGGLEDIRWTNIDISTLHCDLDFECSNPFFSLHRTRWLMLMYYQTKLGCQGINSSEDIVERLI